MTAIMKNKKNKTAVVVVDVDASPQSAAEGRKKRVKPAFGRPPAEGAREAGVGVLKVKTLTGVTMDAVYGAKERDMQFWEYLQNVLYPLFASMGARLEDDKVSVVGCRFFLNCGPTMSFSAPPQSAAFGGPSLREPPSAGEDDDVLIGKVVMGKQYAFNYANRLLKMGDVAAQPAAEGGPLRGGAAIHCVLDIGGPPLAGHFSDLVGNAVGRDVRVECAICLDMTPKREGGKGLANYVLMGCECRKARYAGSGGESGGHRAAQSAGPSAADGHWFHEECVARVPKRECPLCRSPFERRDALFLAFVRGRLAGQRL